MCESTRRSTRKKTTMHRLNSPLPSEDVVRCTVADMILGTGRQPDAAALAAWYVNDEDQTTLQQHLRRERTRRLRAPKSPISPIAVISDAVATLVDAKICPWCTDSKHGHDNDEELCNDCQRFFSEIPRPTPQKAMAETDVLESQARIPVSRWTPSSHSRWVRAATGVATPAATGGNASSQSRWVRASTFVATGAATGGHSAAMLIAPVTTEAKVSQKRQRGGASGGATQDADGEEIACDGANENDSFFSTFSAAIREHVRASE
jgi:hypothetical protein